MARRIIILPMLVLGILLGACVPADGNPRHAGSNDAARPTHVFLARASGTEAPEGDITCNVSYKTHADDASEEEKVLTPKLVVGEVMGEDQSLRFKDLVFHADYRGPSDVEAQDPRVGGRTLRVWVSVAGGSHALTVQSYNFPREGPTNQFGTQGFTGLRYVYNPTSGAELRYLCKTEVGEVDAGTARIKTQDASPESIACEVYYRPSDTVPIQDSAKLTLRPMKAQGPQSASFKHFTFVAQYKSAKESELSAVKISVRISGRNQELVTHLYPLVARDKLTNQFPTHGFSGLGYAYHPDSGAELQYICETPQIPVQGANTVKVTFRLTLNGDVPPGESFDLWYNYEPGGEVLHNEPGQLCGAMSFGVTCKGGGTVYTRMALIPRGTRVTYAFEKNLQSLGPMDDPARAENIARRTQVVNGDTIISAAYAYPGGK